MKKALMIIALAAVMAVASRADAQELPVWKAADLKAAIDSAKGPVIINFWATFCKPCIAEMPHFQSLASQFKARGIKLVFVSLDLKEAYPKSIRSFLKKRNITAPVVFLDEQNADLFVPLVDSTWSGAIPASLFINPERGYRHFVEDEVSREKLEAEIRKMLGDSTNGATKLK
jgi:thiol-disulfide isomerase/thioredoxin